MKTKTLEYAKLLRHASLNHSEAGVTLVEAIIASMMFSLTVFAVVPTLTQFQLQAATNEDRSAAVAVAQQVLDSIRRTPADALPSSGATTTLPSYVGGGSTSNLPYRGQYYDATITYCQTTSLCDTNSRQVVVQVAQNGRYIYKVETLFTKFE